jgi:hypothetical protein
MDHILMQYVYLDWCGMVVTDTLSYRLRSPSWTVS